MFFLLFISRVLSANNIDSLKHVLSGTYNAEKKIEIYTLLSKQYRVTDLDKARKMADKAMNLSLTTGANTWLGEIYGLYGDLAVMQDSLNKAEKYYESSLKYFSENKDLKGMTGVTLVLGNIAFTHNDFLTAMKHYLKTIEYAKKSGLVRLLPSVYMNIGSIYLQSGQPKEAQSYYSRSLKGFLKRGDSMLVAKAYENLGITYIELTSSLMYQVKNNEFIVSISKKLKKLYSKTSPENKALINELIREMELDSSMNQWEEFEIRFQQVHNDFYKNIGKKFPDITSNELRLCAFLKLNMNTKDIAAITYQSVNSITVARWRLRQKLGLKKEERLAAFLSRF